MQCDICHRSASSRLPCYCTLCSRDAVYRPRIQLAQTLLQQQSLGKDIEQNTTSASKQSKPSVSKDAQSPQSQLNLSWIAQRASAEQTLSQERTDSALHHIQILREEIQKSKDDLTKRKARLHRRRSEFASARQELQQNQANGIGPVEKSIRRTEHKWDILHNRTAGSRLFLCREAALLYGLQQRKRKKGGLGRDVYFIGGVPIADLRDLNNASPTQVTTSTTNLAYLVHLVSHYLSLRLPAEIILPHRDYPSPTISSPSSSYSGRDVPFPGSTPSHSSENSPSASRHAEQRSLPRPRPLHLEKKLSSLAKDDQIAYASFVEGITFLAWDVAWLCKTQGMNIGDNSWEEVCALGKNLWQFLLAPLTRPPIFRDVSSKSTPQKPLILHSPDARSGAPSLETPQGFPAQGHFSHSTVYGYLAAAAGTQHMRAWRLQSPIKVIEKVKTMLLAERMGAEWEILDGNEWEIEENEADSRREPKLVNRFSVEETGVLVKPEPNDNLRGERAGESEKDEKEGKEKSESGWMKLKNR